MTLLLAALAAAATTVLWYFKDGSNRYRLGTLALIYWGATLMWLVDAAAAYLEEGAASFQPQPAELLNDAFLGLSVVVLGLFIWLALLLWHDPKGVLRQLMKSA